MTATASDQLEACLRLLRMQARLVRRFDTALGDLHGLGLVDFQLLLELYRAPDGRLRRVELAERMSSSALAVTRLLGPLERIGLVSREANPRDVRLAYAALTPAGRERVREALVTAEHVAERLFAEREDAGELLGLGGELQRLSLPG
jgi:DNA-binding MarR family transcriptional regulator